MLLKPTRYEKRIDGFLDCLYFVRNDGTCFSHISVLENSRNATSFAASLLEAVSWFESIENGGIKPVADPQYKKRMPKPKYLD